MYWQGWVRWV